jgi:2-methylfumaryl-CoA hydratase
MDGPYFDELQVGMTIPPLPPVTLTDGDNVVYRTITGDQHRFAADVPLFQQAGGHGRLVNPGLVMHYSIGQTTNATRRAIANLYYRSVRVLRPVAVGDTLTTEAKVLGLRTASAKDGQHRGKVWLGIRSWTSDGVVAEYERCALLPSRVEVTHGDEIPGPADGLPLESFTSSLPMWNLESLPATDWSPDTTRVDTLRDHIDLAPGLARMTFNQAAVHRDVTLAANGKRLVYGGHVQALAQASLTRLLPGLTTVVAWDGCDHLAPAYENDLLEFSHRLVEQIPAGSGRLMRFEVIGRRVGAGDPVDLLRWTPVVWGV